MSTFNEFQNMIKTKKKVEVDSSILLQLNLVDNDKDNFKLKDKALFYSLINKENYQFRIYIIPKKIPEKIKDSNNYLDYNINEYYFLNIAVNDSQNICEITLKRYNNINDSKIDFRNVIDYINNNDIATIFNYLISNLQT